MKPQFNVNALTKPIQKAVTKLRNKTVKHSPDILVIGGVVTMIVGSGLAIKSSLDVKDVLTDAETELEDIRADEELLANSNNPDDSKALIKDKAGVYIHYGTQLARMYLPAALCIFGGATAVCKGHFILKDRNAALVASYATLDAAYSAYRNKIAENLGSDKAAVIEHGLVTEKVKGEDGKKHAVTHVDSKQSLSMYAYPFKKIYEQVDSKGKVIEYNNPRYVEDDLYNLASIKAAETYANLHLETHGRVYLNEVFEHLGITPKTTDDILASRVMGWVDDGTIHQITFFSYVEEGVDPYEQPEYILRDEDGNFVLDFNVACNVLENL